jgi:pyruvate dehydrogenase E2 component (dihydrolipoamide acetyltransferase)
MITKFIMPRLSETSDSAKIAEWYVRKGETVKKGQPLVAVESDKATIDIESPANGFVCQILLQQGEVGQVQAVLALIGESATDDLNAIEPGVPTNHEMVQERVPRADGERHPETSDAQRHRILASPMAVQLAGEKGIKLSEVRGTGPAGRITKEDVLAAASAQQASGTPVIDRVIPFSPARATIAKKMADSKQNVPHAYILMEVNMGEVLSLRKELALGLSEGQPLDCSVTDLLIKAVALALRGFLVLNSRLQDEKIIVYKDINIGFAVSQADEGLVVPVIHKADQKSIWEIAQATGELVSQAREGRIKLDNLSASTFTISNLGMYEVDNIIPIINPPECCTLGIGKITRKPVVVGDDLDILPMMQMTLSFDHRIVDGALAARFLQRLKNILMEPKIMIKMEQ